MDKENYQASCAKIIAHLKQDTATLRTGRATPALVEDIMVEAYGVKQAMKALASIIVADAKTLTIEPWDKSILAAIETAARNSPLGINPVNDGKLLRLPLPELTADRRAELIKVLYQKLEAARISLRRLRDENKKDIEKKETAGELSEDEMYKQIEVLDKTVKEYNEIIKKIGEEKAKEINTI